MEYIKVGHSQTKGQGLFSRHAVSPLDTLYSAQKLALAAINTSDLDKFCYYCYAGSTSSNSQWHNIGQYRDAKLQFCTGCKVAHFCDKACQSHAWKQFHKYECKIFAALQPNILPEQVRAVMTFLLQRDNGLLPDGVWSGITSSTSHIEDLRRRNDEDWKDMLLMAKAAHVYSKTRVDITIVLQLICILKVNGLTLSTTSGDPIGVFLDPIVMKLNHDCNGNVIVYRPTYTNTVGWLPEHRDKPIFTLLPTRALGEGEELTISYIDFTSHVTRRQEELKQNYLFTCTCTKCLRDTQLAQRLNATKPDVARLRTEWQAEVRRHLEPLKRPPFPVTGAVKALTSVLEAMEAQADSYFSPATDPYPQAVRELKLLHMGEHKAYDKALICALKEHLLVGPAVYSSPYFPTRVVNAIYLLQVLALLDDNEAFEAGSSGDSARLTEQRRDIEEKGLSRKTMKYWRLRICIDTRTCLSKTPMGDLAACLEFEQMSIGINDQNSLRDMMGSESMRVKAEDEVRKIMGLSGERWERFVRPGLEGVGLLRPIG